MGRSLILCAWSAVAIAQQHPAALLTRYCSGCHNAKLKTAGYVVDPAAFDKAAAQPAHWEKAWRKLRARQMPPAGLPRPDEKTYDALVAALETQLDAVKPNPGRPDAVRRLTRTEYRNAIRDLLAVELDVASLLPPDSASHGFDNVTVADLSPTLMERYLGAARKIARLAVGSPVKSPGGDTITLPPDLTQEEHFSGQPLGTRGGARVTHPFPQDAEYEIVLRLARDRNEHVEGIAGRHEVELTLDGERIGLFTVKPPPPGQDHSKIDQHLHARVAVKAGPHTVGAAFLKKPSLLLETERQPYQAHFNMDRHPRITPALYSVSINGPYEPRGPGDTPSRRRVFSCTTSDEACAARIVKTLARRAWRRDVTDAELAAPMKFYREGRDEAGHENGVEMALRAILVSPEFLFRVESDPPGAAPGTVYRLGDFELASRLSFFLWSSIPDDALLDAAAAGQLRTREGLERQTRRLLADPRSRALVDNFASQWLYLRNLAGHAPDMRLFPDFDDNLRQAFRVETEMFFESVMREDRSILDLIRADYTFLNERLAKHYGVPNVYGSRFRLVEFGPEAARGGLLRHGSILTVTSYATRTSPVIRGKWILENILGTPPPPPPAAVPALKEKVFAGKTLTMRQRLSEHRDNPACSGCHQLMDPVGFALENFDAVGRWRTHDDGAPVDADGGLPDGSRFAGAAALKDAVLRRPDLFAGTFTEKLLTYALGRGVESCDAPAVRRIVREGRAADFKFSSFVLGIVNSTPFQMRRSL